MNLGSTILLRSIDVRLHYVTQGEGELVLLLHGFPEFWYSWRHQIRLIWGEDDVVLGKELTYDMEPYFTDRFDIKYIPDCSHWVQREQPELVNQYTLEFLSDLIEKP